ILLHQLLGNENRVFEVVTTPWHKGHEHVTAEAQFAVIGTRTVSNDLALLHVIALLHNRFLVDTSVLVRALELRELVNVATYFTRELHRMMLALHAHDDALRIHRVHHARPACQHHCTRITRGNTFHAGAHDRGFGAEKRNGLPLHVCAHQRAVRVVV